MSSRHLTIMALALLAAGFLSLQLYQPLAVTTQWHLLWSPARAESFNDFNFAYAQLPRALMSIIVGATLGLVGSLMQQLTQNTLTSPLTLGTSSGAWLALIVVNILWPAAAADYHALAAMGGAMLAFAFIIVIAGLNNLTGLPLVIAGMVVNILLGAIATAIILLNQEYAQNVFMWGAGDLAQNGWDWVRWLLPRLSIAIPLLLLAPRLLTLLRLGHDGAAARGLAVIPIFFLLMISGIWLVSAAITAVGLIGFIGLLTPNIVRALGARTPRMELLASMLAGAILLLLTDTLAQGLTNWIGQLVPSGVTAAAIGAPALIWFSRRSLKAQDNLTIELTSQRRSVSVLTLVLLGMLSLAGIVLYLTFQPTAHNWAFAWPSNYQWTLRWPRASVAIAAGVGLALAGTILQRLIYNPLASPDILGVSSGATFTLVFTTLFIGQGVLTSHWLVAFIGSMAVIGILILLGRRTQYAPASLILTGIAVSALLQAFVQFCLAKGNQDSYQIMQWLAGSTYRVTPIQALSLLLGVSVLLGLSLALSRWLTLLSVGRSFTSARGLSPARATLCLLIVVALLCSLVTATMGPVAFVGLVAPHLALMLGARKVHAQLLTASLAGGCIMLWADWLGQILLFPNQIAAGTLVAIIGAVYFLILLIINRIRR